MCGIVGYIGPRQAAPILISGLEKLEYRGYDSAGIAIHDGQELTVYKAKGRLKVLQERVNPDGIAGNLGIGHTRWATHGEPSDENSHPHTSGKIAVVHNGIIENYLKIKAKLEKKGYLFTSMTDTEVVAHLVNDCYQGDLLAAVIQAVSRLEGSFALGVLCQDCPDKMIAVRKSSPLIVGLGDGENFIASDIPAILEYTREVYLLDDNQIAVVSRTDVQVYDQFGERVQKDVFHITWDVKAAEKGGYEHFMLKEIHEEPKILHDTLSPRLGEDGGLNLSELGITAQKVRNIRKIIIVACGTAYHAGIIGKYYIEKMTRIPVDVDIASEFRYRDPIIHPDDYFIIISQSGETADTLAALREAKARGARVAAITNVVGSSVSREADDVFFTWAGPEIAVASTKAYNAQLMALYILGTELAWKQGNLPHDQYVALIQALRAIPDHAAKVLANKEAIQHYASRHYAEKHVFYIGRGMDYALSMEGTLKLKEISYIHSEAYAAGELKHGPIALFEEGTLIFASMTQETLYDKMVSNIKECKARGAVILAVAMEGNEDIEQVADEIIYIPRTLEAFAPVLAIIPAQLFAYYVAVNKGCDVDKPRNLAKSVTVE